MSIQWKVTTKCQPYLDWPLHKRRGSTKIAFISIDKPISKQWHHLQKTQFGKTPLENGVKIHKSVWLFSCHIHPALPTRVIKELQKHQQEKQFHFQASIFMPRPRNIPDLKTREPWVEPESYCATIYRLPLPDRRSKVRLKIVCTGEKLWSSTNPVLPRGVG